MNQIAKLESNYFLAPVHDSRFVELGDDLRDLVCQRLAAMQTIATAGTIANGLKKVLEMHGGKKGWGRGTIRNLWFEFFKTNGDWTKLLNKAQGGSVWWQSSAERGLKAGFIEYVGEKWAEHQRGKFRSAHHDIVRQYKRWRSGDESAAIKGYDRCPKPAKGSDLPAGWSYENLMRVGERAASRFARKMIQIGPKAAVQFRLKTLTDRAGLEVGQYYVIDDSWNDFKVLYRGQGVRLLSLHALDLASGCNLVRGYKPAVEDERGIEERLREREVVFLLAALFSTEGYNPNGTTIICEKSTATVRTAERELLARMFGDKFDVQDGPRGGGAGVAGLFTGPGGGNPNWKAPLESWFNLLRNRTDSLLEFPGQTGSNARLNGPEGLAKMVSMDEAVSRAMQILPPERAKLMRFNLLSHWDACPALDAVTEVINCRHDHDLQGWRESGNYVSAFRLAEHLPWLPAEMLLQLPEAEQEQIGLMLKVNKNLTGEICLSPRQVYNTGRSRLKKFTPVQTALFLAGTDGAEEGVKQGLLEVHCPDVNPDEPLRFGPIIRDCQGREEVMGQDAKYMVRVNPFQPGVAFLYNADNGFAGLASSYGRIRRDDEEKLQDNWKTKAKAVSAWTKEARKLAAPITAKASAIAGNNAKVIKDFEDAPALEKKATERTLRRLAKDHDGADAASIIAGGAEPEPTEGESAADTLLSAITGRNQS